jgi:hypothetical protein
MSKHWGKWMQNCGEKKKLCLYKEGTKRVEDSCPYIACGERNDTEEVHYRERRLRRHIFYLVFSPHTIFLVLPLLLLHKQQTGR